jgi:hypothetical protein
MWKFYIFSPVANTAERSTPAAETDEPTKDLVQVLSYNEHCEYSHCLKFQSFKSICSWPITVAARSDVRSLLDYSNTEIGVRILGKEHM